MKIKINGIIKVILTLGNFNSVTFLKLELSKSLKEYREGSFERQTKPYILLKYRLIRLQMVDIVKA